jgi:hypothetical protein
MISKVAYGFVCAGGIMALASSLAAAEPLGASIRFVEPTVEAVACAYYAPPSPPPDRAELEIPADSPLRGQIIPAESRTIVAGGHTSACCGASACAASCGCHHHCGCSHRPLIHAADRLLSALFAPAGSLRARTHPTCHKRKACASACCNSGHCGHGASMCSHAATESQHAVEKPMIEIDAVSNAIEEDLYLAAPAPPSRTK